MTDISAKLEAVGLDAVLITYMNNIFRLCGFKGTAGQLFVTRKGAYLITDFRYLTQAKEQTEGVEIIDIAKGEKDIFSELIKKDGIKKVGFEQSYVTYERFMKLRALFAGTELFGIKGIVEKMRIIKTENEVNAVKRACEIADNAFETVCPQIKPGVSELEIAAKLEYEMKRSGAAGTSFETIVASGKRSAMPHGTASTKVIENGDFVVMDFGCIFDGYCSDITRTVAVGNISDKQRDIYNKVLTVQQEALALVKPGAQCKEIDLEARRMFKTWGIDKFFGHSLGHGVGLDIHELPNLSSKSEYVLDKNMIVTVEPGIYLENEFGVRIEDTVCVGENGGIRLTTSDKNLRICR